MRTPPLRSRRNRAFLPLSDALEARAAVSTLDLGLIALSSLPQAQTSPVSTDGSVTDPGTPLPATPPASNPSSNPDDTAPVPIASGPETGPSFNPPELPITAAPTPTAPTVPSDSTPPAEPTVPTLSPIPSTPSVPNGAPSLPPVIPTVTPTVPGSPTAPGDPSLPPNVIPGPIIPPNPGPIIPPNPNPDPIPGLIIPPNPNPGPIIPPNPNPGPIIPPTPIDASPTPTVVFMGNGISRDQDGSYFGVVGGKVNLFVYPAINVQPQAMTISIGGAIQDQTYVWQQGKTTRLPSPIVVNNPGADPELESFYWDETTGNHTITVQETFQGGGLSAPVTFNVDVRAPIVNSFQNSFTAFTFNSYSVGVPPQVTPQYGLSQGNGLTTPGSRLTASIDTTGLPGEGRFAIIQLTQIKRNITAGGGNFSQTSQGFVLDNPYPVGYFADVTFAKYQSDAIAPNTFAVAIPSKDYSALPNNPDVPKGVVIDSPYLGFEVKNNDPTKTSWTYMSMNDTFQSYLVYQPTSGVWIALSKLTWQLSGAIEKDPVTGTWSPFNLPPLPGEVPVPNPSPAVPGIARGGNQRSLISWTNSVFPSFPAIPAGLGTYWMLNGQPQFPPAN